MSETSPLSAKQAPWSAPDSIGYGVWNWLTTVSGGAAADAAVSLNTPTVYDRHLSFLNSLTSRPLGNTSATKQRYDDLRVFRLSSIPTLAMRSRRQLPAIRLNARELRLAPWLAHERNHAIFLAMADDAVNGQLKLNGEIAGKRGQIPIARNYADQPGQLPDDSRSALPARRLGGTDLDPLMLPSARRTAHISIITNPEGIFFGQTSSIARRSESSGLSEQPTPLWLQPMRIGEKGSSATETPVDLLSRSSAMKLGSAALYALDTNRLWRTGVIGWRSNVAFAPPYPDRTLASRDEVRDSGSASAQISPDALHPHSWSMVASASDPLRGSSHTESGSLKAVKLTSHLITNPAPPHLRRSFTASNQPSFAASSGRTADVAGRIDLPSPGDPAASPWLVRRSESAKTSFPRRDLSNLAERPSLVAAATLYLKGVERNLVTSLPFAPTPDRAPMSSPARSTISLHPLLRKNFLSDKVERYGSRVSVRLSPVGRPQVRGGTVGVQGVDEAISRKAILVRREAATLGFNQSNRSFASHFDRDVVGHATTLHAEPAQEGMANLPLGTIGSSRIGAPSSAKLIGNQTAYLPAVYGAIPQSARADGSALVRGDFISTWRGGTWSSLGPDRQVNGDLLAERRESGSLGHLATETDLLSNSESSQHPGLQITTRRFSAAAMPSLALMGESADPMGLQPELDLRHVVETGLQGLRTPAGLPSLALSLAPEGLPSAPIKQRVSLYARRQLKPAATAPINLSALLTSQTAQPERHWSIASDVLAPQVLREGSEITRPAFSDGASAAGLFLLGPRQPLSPTPRLAGDSLKIAPEHTKHRSTTVRASGNHMGMMLNGRIGTSQGAPRSLPQDLRLVQGGSGTSIATSIITVIGDSLSSASGVRTTPPVNRPVPMPLVASGESRARTVLPTGPETSPRFSATIPSTIARAGPQETAPPDLPVPALPQAPSASGLSAPASQTPQLNSAQPEENDVDEFAEQAWKSLMSRLAIEQERRGYARWA